MPTANFEDYLQSVSYQTTLNFTEWGLGLQCL